MALIALAAMLSPTTLTFSVLALVMGDRPLRTGFWFYVGALTATLAVGVVAAFVIGDIAASKDSTPKTWVAVLDVVAAAAILLLVLRAARKPVDPTRVQGMIDQMSGLATASVAAVGRADPARRRARKGPPPARRSPALAGAPRPYDRLRDPRALGRIAAPE